MEEHEHGNVYAIPANYTDSGKILGGMLEPRNAIENGFRQQCFLWIRNYTQNY